MNRKTQRIHQTISLIMLVAMIGHLLLVPTAVHAQQLNIAENPVAQRSEQLFTAAPEAMSHALTLGQMMADINATNTADLTEETLITAKEHALQTAEKATVAQGALDAIVYSVAQGDYQLQTATDMDAQLGTLAATEFVSETVAALVAAGLTSAQIDQLANSANEKFQVRRDIEQDGLDAATENLLTTAGLSTSQIADIETEAASYGLADYTLPTRLTQLEAAATEMSLVRSQALTAYAQLLTRHVIWQQLNGVSARSLTAADLEMLAEDQIRLLTHISYLENLSPDNPNPNLGEGQWLFVERYSSQAVTHIDTLILETQNLGLIVDLYVMLGIHATAQAAQSGGANLASEEITMWGDVLAGMNGDDLPDGPQARHAVPPLTLQIAAAITQFSGYDAFTLFSNTETEVEEPAVALTTQRLKGRMSRIAATAATMPLVAGSVTELDETNNEARVHFYATGITPFPPEIQQLLLPYIPHLGVILDSFIGVLLGQTQNPWEIGGNIILSFVPVLGEVIDLLTLMFVPRTWDKVFAAIGLGASLVSDLAEIITLLGVVFPPAAVAAVVAVPAEGADVGAAIMKNLPNLVGGTLKNIIHKIPFSDALKLGLQSIMRMSQEAMKVIGTVDNWPTSLNGVLDLMNSVKTRVTEPFLALLTRFGNNLGKLYQLGFGDGGFLLGRVLNLSDEAATYSDETLESIANMGADLAFELDDEAVEGLGEATDTLGETNVRRLFSCFIDATVQAQTQDKSSRVRFAKLSTANSSDPISDFCSDALAVFGRLDDPRARDGVKKMLEDTSDAEWVEDLLITYADRENIEPLNNLLLIVDESNHDLWQVTEWQTLDDILLSESQTEPSLSRNAIKFFPLTALDVNFQGHLLHYPRFTEFLEESTYISDYIDRINQTANTGEINSLMGHMYRIVGEYRERRYLRVFGDPLGNHKHNIILSHMTDGRLDASFSGPIDAITKDPRTNKFFIGEAKDKGISAGTIMGGMTSGSQLKVDDFTNYFLEASNGHYVLNRGALEKQLNIFVDDGLLSESQRFEIIKSIETGDLELNIFAGGREDPFGNNLINAVGRGLINPYTETGYPKINVNLITDVTH